MCPAPDLPQASFYLDMNMQFRVVVPNLNYGEFLDACLASIEGQMGVDVRVLIIDGGSIDNSKSISQEYCQRNGWTFLEKEGMGQAASIAYGLSSEHWPDADDEAIYCWLNSDDIFLRSDSLSLVAEQFEKFFDVDVVSLGGYFISGKGRLQAPVTYDYHPLLRGDVFARGGAFLQPATFWSGKVNRSVAIDTAYRYVFDGDYFLRMRGAGFNFYVNPRLHVAGYRLHGSNLSLNVPPKRVAELGDLHRRRLSRPVAGLYLSIVSALLKGLGAIPVIGERLKRTVRSVNNAASYLTRYLIPSI